MNMKIVNVLIILGGALVILVRWSFFSLPETLGDNWVFYEMLPFYVLNTVAVLLFVNCLVRIKRDGENLKHTEYEKWTIVDLGVLTMIGTMMSVSLGSQSNLFDLFYLGKFNDTHLWTIVFLCFYFFIILPKLKLRYESLAKKGETRKVNKEESDLIVLNLRD